MASKGLPEKDQLCKVSSEVVGGGEGVLELPAYSLLDPHSSRLPFRLVYKSLLALACLFSLSGPCMI